MYPELKIQVRAACVGAGMSFAETSRIKFSYFSFHFVPQDKPSPKMEALPHVFYNQPNKILCLLASRVREITQAPGLAFFLPHSGFCWMRIFKTMHVGGQILAPTASALHCRKNCPARTKWAELVAASTGNFLCTETRENQAGVIHRTCCVE